MEAKCRISTSIEKGLTTFFEERSHQDTALLRVLTDSKRLSFFQAPTDRRQLYPLSGFFEIGLERAFGGMPAKRTLFQSKVSNKSREERVP